MIYSWLKKIKNVICFVIMFCIMIPIATACGPVDNGLTENKQNSKIGVGGDIDAYTTYRTAPLKMMSQNLYYSYLMNYRPFILVVVPDGSVDIDSETGSVIKLNDNYMLKSAAAGVFQYNENYTSYTENELKLLMYYVRETDFRTWEENATNNSFAQSAYNFIKINNASSTETAREFASGNFDCDKIVNFGSYLANSKDNKISCALDESQGDFANSIFNVGQGIILLYGEGSLDGYIRDSDIRKYIDDKSILEEGIKKLVPEHYQNIINGLRLDNNFDNESKSAVYKAMFDNAIWSRIKKLNKFTKVDFSNNSDSFNNKYQKDNFAIPTYNNNNKNVMLDALSGSGEFENNSYVTFVTAKGFTIERGDIATDGLLGTLSEDYALILEELMRMDSCPNETVAAILMDWLSTGALIAGGAILVASLFVTPFPGARIVALALLIAGFVVKAVMDGAASTDINYCELYRNVLIELKKSSTFAVPVIGYEIPRDSGGQTIYLCNVMVEEGEECPEEEKLDLYYYADLATVEEFDITGAPYLAFYHNGQLVDYIYGSADSTFISEILSSWGVLVTPETKYFSSFSAAENKLTIVDNGKTSNERTAISYGYSFDYGSNELITSSNFGSQNLIFNDANSYTVKSGINNQDEYIKQKALEDVRFGFDENRIDFSTYVDDIRSANSFEDVNEQLKILKNEVTKKANVNKETILSKITDVSNYVNTAWLTDIRPYYLKNNSNGNKYYAFEDVVAIDGVKYKVSGGASPTFTSLVDKDIVIKSSGTDADGNLVYTFGEQTYSLDREIISISIIRNYFADKLNDAVSGLEYYAVDVPVYITAIISEKFYASPGNVVDETNNQNCKQEDIRVNKIWGNYKCVHDLKWYHIKSNWAHPETEIVTSNTTAKYKDLNVSLKFE